MHPDLTAALTSEHQHDLIAAADRHRLASAAAPSVALRARLGRRLIALGTRISGSKLTL